MNFRTLLAAVALLLAGCISPTPAQESLDMDVPASLLVAPVDAQSLDWPDFHGETLRILDHGAFDYAFDSVKPLFEILTNSTVEHTGASDAGTALEQAITEAGAPTFDVLYGVDNAYWVRAMETDVFHPYTPKLAPRVHEQFVFFDDAQWPATPVDHGYIALNVDPRHESLNGTTIESLEDVRDHADLFVTEDPRTSSPGLGFLLATVAAYPEGGMYDWQDYWMDLFAGGVLVTSGWSEAYETHFSGGYGIWTEGHLGDRPIVTSYTTSPAYEAYYEASEIAEVLLGDAQHPAISGQIQTMGILRGTEHLALAQAWIEFTLTVQFQAQAALSNAIYPVDADVDTDGVYGDLDVEPQDLDVAWADPSTLDLQDLLHTWTDLYEAAQA